MYSDFFGFREQPFKVTPNPRFFFANRVYQEAYASLLYGVRDMTRVIYYAGQRPLVPRRFSAEEVAASALEITIRYVVLGEQRDTTARVVEQLAADFEFMGLPPEIAASAEDRGILVLRRK